jgi:hypothetical protein
LGHKLDRFGPKNIVIVYRKTLGFLNLALLFGRWNLWRVHPRRFWWNLNTVAIKRPIFLLGVQGGGLTLTARMLRRHPDAVSITGDHTYWAGPDEMHVVMGPDLPPELSGISHHIPPNPTFPRRDWLYATDELLPLYRKKATDATPELVRQFRQAIRLALIIHAKDLRRARFIDKSQSYTVRLSLVNRLLKEDQPHFILVTRNPYPTCYRAATAVTPISQLNLPLKRRLELAAQHWDNSFRTALADSDTVEHFLEVRFEDLLQNPMETLQRICAFSGLDYHPSMLPAPDHRFPLGSTGSSKGDHKWYPLRPDVNRRYLKQLEPWMIETVANRVAELAERWGYSPEGP